MLAHMLVPDGVAAESTFLFVSFAAVGVAAVGAWRQQGLARRVGVAVAIGLVLSAIGDATWSVWSLTQPAIPDASVFFDLPWLASYAAISAGLFALMRGEQRRVDRDAVIDVLAVLVMGLVIEWQLVIGSTLGDATLSVPTRLVWALYPAFDAVLLALVVRIVVSHRRSASAVGSLVAAGAACWLVSDLMYTVYEGASVRWLNLGWMLGASCFAAGTWQRAGSAPDTSDAAEVDRTGFGRVAIALVPLLVPGVIELITYFQGTDPNPVPLLMATAVLVGLAYLRTVRVLQAEHAARRALRSEKRFATALAVNSSDAVALVDADARLIREAPQLAALVGSPGTPNLGLDLMPFVEPSHLGALRAVIDRCLSAPGRVFELEVEARHAEGHLIWLAVRMVNRLDDPDVRGVVLNLHDVSARKAAEDELTRQAFHDGLTGLANRVLFADRVEHALRRSARSGLQPALIYLDLDGFKYVNDSLGHPAGDQLLRTVGDRLLGSLRPGDTVARLGGDEFAILIEESARPTDEGVAVAERIVQALTIPIELGERALTVSASIGIAVGDSDATALTLLRDADIAMYQAKTNGKARWVVFDGELRSAAVERLELENDLVGALDAGQLRLVYQPVVNLETDDIVGFEALLRWDHPRLGLIVPDRFIPIAEQTGLIIPIGRWVLENACKTAASWQRQFPRLRPLTMAVNVSAKQLAHADFGRYVAESLARSDLPASTLVLEITETVLIEDPEATAEHLNELHRLGVRLAIDDFGTGYSSLSYLRQFPIDILKIDRSFINTITRREEVPAIVRGLIDLGHTLELETVAEGIEQNDQHQALRDEHCELGQGFLFAEPLPPDDAELLLLQLEARTTIRPE
jgi:diguanylate cyclase (GGDEF)-like protein/PAS domain S-box-containing protein